MSNLIKEQVRYSFNHIGKCNMCGSPTSQHHVLGRRMNRSQGKNPKTKTGITVSIAKCSNCGLIYSNPLPIPYSIQDHYGIPPESYWREEYFTVHESHFQGEIHVLKQLLTYSTGAKSLDIGAGLGKTMSVLAKAGFDTYGFEPSEPFHKMAIERMKIDADKLKLGMIETVEYPENYFDFITFGAVLEHLYDPSASIIKALRWLKPNGIIHIEVPSSEWLINKILNAYYILRGTDYVANLSPMHTPFHLYEFGLKSFQEHGKLNNYEIALHQFYVCDTYLPKVLDFVLKPYMKKTDQGMQLCVWLRKK